MNIETHSSEAQEASTTLLAHDQNFMILKAAGYGSNYNITYRSPRTIGNTVMNLTCTSTIDGSRLNGLRVETMDDKYFVVNDSSDDGIGMGRGARLRVVNADVGHQIVKCLVEMHSDRALASDEAETQITESSNPLRVAHNVVEALLSLICLASLPLLAISASHWLLTH